MMNIVRVCADERKENMICYDFNNGKFYKQKISNNNFSVIALAGVSSGFYALLNYLTNGIGIDFDQYSFIVLITIVSVILGFVAGLLTQIYVKKTDLKPLGAKINNFNTIVISCRVEMNGYKKICIFFCCFTVVMFVFAYLSDQIGALIIAFLCAFFSSFIIVFSDFRKKQLFLERMKEK